MSGPEQAALLQRRECPAKGRCRADFLLRESKGLDLDVSQVLDVLHGAVARVLNSTRPWDGAAVSSRQVIPEP